MLLRLSAATALVVALTAGSAGARAPLCADRSGRELARFGADRVLEVRQASPARRGDTTVRVVSCRGGSRAVKVLYRAVSRDDLAYRAEFGAMGSARFAVVALSGATPSAGWVDLNAYDLATGRRVATVHRCTVDALWAGRSGGFAFLDGSGPASIVDAAGLRTAGGPGAQDFAVGGDTLYWTEAGAVRSAPLGGAPHGAFGKDVDCG